jgi:hypothetical protein
MLLYRNSKHYSNVCNVMKIHLVMEVVTWNCKTLGKRLTLLYFKPTMFLHEVWHIYYSVIVTSWAPVCERNYSRSKVGLFCIRCIRYYCFSQKYERAVEYATLHVSTGGSLRRKWHDLSDRVFQKTRGSPDVEIYFMIIFMKGVKLSA